MVSRAPGSVARPLLVAAAVAGPQLQQGAVGRSGAGGVQAQTGLVAGDRAVGVDRPLLVAASGAAPDVHLGAGAGALARGVQAVAAVDPQLTGGGVRPLLVAAAVAVPQRHLGAGRLRLVRYVHAPAGADSDDRAGRAAVSAAARRDGQV